jgi:hypothetical protein
VSATVPVVEAHLLPPRRSGGAWLAVVTCPHCGTQHIHGAGSDGVILGHRLSHCVTARPMGAGYVLEVAEGEAP